MAILIDQANAGTAADDNGGTTIAVNTTQTIATGLIVVSVTWWHATGTLSSISGGGLTWAIAVQGKHSVENPAAAIAYAQAPAGLASGTAITANFSTTVNARAIGITSFTGAATSSPVDTTDPVLSENDNSWHTNSVAILAGSVLVAHSHLDKTATSTVTAPSIEALDWGDGANFACTTCYRIEASAASYAVAGTYSDSLYHVTVAAAFKVAGAAAATAPAARRRRRVAGLTIR